MNVLTVYYTMYGHTLQMADSAPGMIHTEARGGTPYGASTIAGPEGELNPTEEDLTIAMALGRRVADVARRLRG